MRPSTRSAASVQSGMRHAHAFFEKLRPRRGLLLWALLPVLLMLASNSAQAQCTLVCNGASQASPNQVAINQNCTVTLVPDVILESPQSCPGDKIMTVRDNANAVIIRDTNLVTFDASAYVDQTLSVTVYDIATTIFCVGFIRVVDNLDPQIICENLVVTCFDSIQPQVLGYPEVTHGIVAAIVMTNLVRQLGRKAAFELVSLGQPIVSLRALELGMVNRVVRNEDVVKEAVAIAEKLAGVSRPAMALTKQLFHQVAELPFDQALDKGREANERMRGFRKGGQ